MSAQPDHIKEAVHAAVVKIESAHMRWQSRLRPAPPLRIPSVSAAMVPLLVAEIRGGRGPKLYVCTQAEAVDLALAMVAHHSRIPLERLLEGDVRERDFPVITAACGRIAVSQMKIIRANRAKELQGYLASIPADMLTLSDVPVADHEAQVIRGLAAARRLTLILEGKTSFVVDNTNVTCEDRARYIPAAKANGFTIRGYFFQSRVVDALARNAKREG